MDHVEGQTYYEMGRAPSEAELARVVEQAARIHRVDACPDPVFDPWAIANLIPLAGQVGHLLDDEQGRLVDATIAALADVAWDELPQALIHVTSPPGTCCSHPTVR
jgi:hypothetical protein